MATFDISYSQNSVGPWGAGGPFGGSGDGQGFYNPTFGGTYVINTCGSSAPDPAFIAGAHVCVCSFIGTGGLGNFVVTLDSGALAANAFTSISFVDKNTVTETYNTSTATFSHPSAGFSEWVWTGQLAYPFTGLPATRTMTVVLPSAPTLNIAAAITESPDTVAATTVLPIAATLASTEGPDTLISPSGIGVMLGLTTNPSASNSFTNLNYALFAATSGALVIYESGVGVGTFGTYTSSTLLNIVYDGKHVAYYAGAKLLRSVPVTGLTLFLQICMGSAGASVYGIDFSPVATAVTPYTLVPMATTVAAAGTRIISNGSGVNGWGTKNFQSKESYSSGVTISASVNPLGDAQIIGLSTAPAVGDATGYARFIAGWYPHGSTPDLEIVFNGSNLGSFGSYVSTSDVLTIAYDNFYFYWYRNNTLVLQKPFPNAGPLYLFGDFFQPNLGFANISISPYSPSTPQQYIARGNHVVSDTNVSKATNSGVWTDGDCYSINGYPTCHVVWKPNQTNASFFVGLVSGAPPASSNFTGLTYGLQCQNNGLLSIYESGTLVSTYGAYTTSDYLTITYDGATVTYAQNGVTLRTVSAAGLTLFVDAVFFNAGALNSLEFGPSATIPLADTAQVGINAATATVTSFTVGPVAANNNA